MEFNNWVKQAEELNLLLKASDLTDAKEPIVCVAIDEVAFKAVEYAADFGIELDHVYDLPMTLFNLAGLTTIEVIDPLPQDQEQYVSYVDNDGNFKAKKATLTGYKIKVTSEKCSNDKIIHWQNGESHPSRIFDHKKPGEDWLSHGSGDGWTRYIPINRIVNHDLPGILVCRNVQ
jgi:hypothetical protein